MSIVGSFLILVLLAGCGAWRMPEKAPASMPVPSKYRFDYTVSNAQPIALLRVLDDGGSTYFQFRDTPPEGLVISAETLTGEAIIPHESMGNYAVIRGVFRQSSIASANQPMVARKLGEIAPMANVGPVVLPKAVLKDAPRPESKPMTAVAREGVRRTLGTHTIRFARNSSKLGPQGRRDLENALAAARQASEIEIRVRPFYLGRQASLRLAQARAETIRAAMLAVVPDHDVRVEAQGAAYALVAEVELRAMQYEVGGAADASPSAEAGEHEWAPRIGSIKTAVSATQPLVGEQP